MTAILDMDFSVPANVPDRDQILADNLTIVTGVEACAKIVTFEGKEFYVKENVHEVNLGREKKTAPDYFQIGDSNTISKLHAKIFWDNTQKCWKIQNLSKNKIYVNFDSL